MKITDISLQSNNKNRCNLLVDGKFFCGLSLETVMKYRLKVGLDVDKKFLDGVVLESEKSDALSKAIAYLSKRLKTKREVKDYLLKKGYTEEIVWFCIDKLKDYKYVDDEFYSKQYISTSSKKVLDKPQPTIAPTIAATINTSVPFLVPFLRFFKTSSSVIPSKRNAFPFAGLNLH